MPCIIETVNVQLKYTVYSKKQQTLQKLAVASIQS